MRLVQSMALLVRITMPRAFSIKHNFVVAFCQASLALISFPWVILSESAYTYIFLLSAVFSNWHSTAGYIIVS